MLSRGRKSKCSSGQLLPFRQIKLPGALPKSADETTLQRK